MTGQEAVVEMYSMENIEPNKEEYDRDVRDALVDYSNRCEDVGDRQRKEHTDNELVRLDKQFNNTVQ